MNQQPSRWQGPGLVLGTSAYNAHVQNMAQALLDAGGLETYATGFVDSYRSVAGRALRRAIGRAWPALDRELSRRAIHDLPASKILSHWSGELPRTIASRLKWDERTVDRLWDRSERALDRACARMMNRPEVGGFLGVEYGALSSLQAAKNAGKPAVVAFLSPHHRTLSTWVEREFERSPELASSARDYFVSLASVRNGRRDEEAATADWIVTGSSFTTRTLVDAGFAREKMITVPLGGPAPVRPEELPASPRGPMRFVFVGSVSVLKGAHYLLRAWRQVAKTGMELHLYGKVLLPDAICQEALAGPSGKSIVFHGSVPPRELKDVYLNASVLVMPTLCDGFGMVVSEALAHGVPVITTTNAGAADAVSNGRTGFVIPPADEAALVSALGWCAEHPHELFAMRRVALEAAARGTWPAFRERFITLLADAVFGGKRLAAEPVAARRSA